MSNLLEKASILLTPTAYDDGKILSVEPEDGTGDFNFTRNSSATRVNSQGLIEDMKILSSNLVTNGDFATDSDWGKINSTISGGTGNLNGTGVTSMLFQDILTNGKTYKVTFTVSDYNSLGNNDMINANGVPLYVLNSNGTFTFTFTHGVSNGNIYWRARNGGVFSIDNVSVIEITDDTNLPRIDYSPYSGAGTCGHWLFEPQSTNLIPYSENFSQSNWIKQAAVILTPNQPSPDGGNNAYKVQGTIGSSYVLDGGFGAITPQSRSIYMRAETNGVIYSLGDGQSKQINVTTEWQRFELQEVSNSFYALDFRGSGVTLDSVYIYGAQLEQNSYATSYIPTSGSTVTRLQDAAFGAGSSDLINSTEGVLYAEISALANYNAQRWIGLSDGTHNNTVKIGILNSTSEYKIACDVRVGGVNQVFMANNFGAVQPTFKKCAVKYKQNDFALWIDGVKVATYTIGNVPTGLNKLSFDRGDGGQDFFGKTKCVSVFKEALTDEELTCLTTI